MTINDQDLDLLVHKLKLNYYYNEWDKMIDVGVELLNDRYVAITTNTPNESIPVAMLVGIAYYQKGNIKKSIQYFNDAIEDWSECWATYLWLGKIYEVEQGNQSKALKTYEMALQWAPDNEAILKKLVSLTFEESLLDKEIYKSKVGEIIHKRIISTTINRINKLIQVREEKGKNDNVEYYFYSIVCHTLLEDQKMIDKLIDKVKDNIIRDGDYTYWAEKSYDIINRYKEDKTTTEEDSEPADHNLNELLNRIITIDESIKILSKQMPHSEPSIIKNKPKIKLPDGTKWDDIRITVQDKENVLIYIKSGTPKKVSFVDLGFRDKRISDYIKPSNLWSVFLLLAYNNGSIDSNSKQHQRIEKIDISRIRSFLSDYFQLPDKPISNYSIKNGWHTIFELSVSQSYIDEITTSPDFYDEELSQSDENQQSSFNENTDYDGFGDNYDPY